MTKFSRSILLLTAMCSAAATAVAEHFFVDSLKGNDTASGLSPEHSWRSLAKVNSLVFKPGDVISFHSGQQWVGTLSPRGSGTSNQKITFVSYGEGTRPRIVGDDTSERIVMLSNVENISIEGFELLCPSVVAGCRAQRGVEVVINGFGVAHGITLRNLYIHDIQGSLEHKNTGGIVIRSLKGSQPSRFDGLIIERNAITHVDRSGIVFESDFVERTVWFPSTGVNIRDNYLEDIGGDGIVPWATNHAVIEWNIVRHAAMRSEDFNAGIWPWSSDDTDLRWNDVSGTGTTKDGEGYDSDYNSRNTLFEHNYSHDNRGGMMLICNPGDYDPLISVGNRGTRVLRNLSHGDSERIFNISGGSDILIEENLIVKPEEKFMQLVVFSKWNGWADHVQIVNNRFLVYGAIMSGHEVSRSKNGTYVIAPGWGGATAVKMDGNSYPPDPTVSPLDEHYGVVKLVGLDTLNWDGPDFHPERGENLENYLESHRAWLLSLFKRTGLR